MRIGSWNTELRLTALTDKKRGAPDQILREIERLDQDILVLPEAFQERPERGVDDSLRDMGYRWVDARYEDKGREALFNNGAMPYMRVLSRLAIQSSEIVRFGDLRNTVAVTVRDPKTSKLVRVYGVHQRDDNKTMRTAGVRDFADHYNESPVMPTIAAGDWNASHGESWSAKLIGSGVLRALSVHLPNASARYYATSVTDMVSGDELAEFERLTGMRDLDPHHRPTTTPKIRGPLEVLPSVPLIQLDHMYANDLIAADRVIVGADAGSDHRSITTTITLGSSLLDKL